MVTGYINPSATGTPTSSPATTVFANGWAFGVGEGGGIRPGLGRLTAHLVPIAGSDAAL